MEVSQVSFNVEAKSLSGSCPDGMLNFICINLDALVSIHRTQVVEEYEVSLSVELRRVNYLLYGNQIDNSNIQSHFFFDFPDKRFFASLAQFNMTTRHRVKTRPLVRIAEQYLTIPSLYESADGGFWKNLIQIRLFLEKCDLCAFRWFAIFGLYYRGHNIEERPFLA